MGKMDGEQLMRTIAAAFEKSDLNPLLDALHDEVVWKSATRHTGLSFHGEYKGRAGVMEVLSNISKDYTFHHLRPREIFCTGDIVWGLFDAGLRYDAKGRAATAKTIQLDMAIHWKLKDGRIIEHQAFFDTAHLLLLQGELAQL